MLKILNLLLENQNTLLIIRLFRFQLLVFIENYLQLLIELSCLLILFLNSIVRLNYFLRTRGQLFLFLGKYLFFYLELFFKVEFFKGYPLDQLILLLQLLNQLCISYLYLSIFSFPLFLLETRVHQNHIFLSFLFLLHLRTILFYF